MLPLARHSAMDAIMHYIRHIYESSLFIKRILCIVSSRQPRNSYTDANDTNESLRTNCASLFVAVVGVVLIVVINTLCCCRQHTVWLCSCWVWRSAHLFFNSIHANDEQMIRFTETANGAEDYTVLKFLRPHILDALQLVQLVSASNFCQYLLGASISSIWTTASVTIKHPA